MSKAVITAAPFMPKGRSSINDRAVILEAEGIFFILHHQSTAHGFKRILDAAKQEAAVKEFDVAELEKHFGKAEKCQTKKGKVFFKAV